MQRTSHPRLARPLVAESVFEVRFSPRGPYGILPGQLFDILGHDFPDVEELPAANFPIEVAFPLVRHRFKSPDSHSMVQAGVGLISINHTRYVGYDDFRSDIQTVLGAAHRLSLLEAITRLGLRYINRAVLDRPWTDIVTYRVHAPSIVEDSAIARRFTWQTPLEGIGTLQTAVAWPLTEGQSAPAMILDFDCYLDRVQRRSADQIITWVDDAHERIYQAFRESLTGSFFDSLKEVANAAVR